MENQMTIFKNPAFGEVRTIKGENNIPWFVGKDVAEALGYRNASDAIYSHVDEEDKTSSVIYGAGSNYKAKTTLINESGLYSLILASKLPQAKQFKRWVTSEILPAIRKDGGYIATRVDDTPEAIMARALLVAKSTIDRLESENAAITQQNRVLSSKAEHLDKVILCNQCYTTTQIGKELNMSVHELNDLLIQKHIIFRQSSQYMLYAEYARLGLAKNRTAEKLMEDGTIKVFHPYLVWTETGRIFIHNLIKENPLKVNPATASRLTQPSLF